MRIGELPHATGANRWLPRYYAPPHTRRSGWTMATARTRWAALVARLS